MILYGFMMKRKEMMNRLKMIRNVMEFYFCHNFFRGGGEEEYFNIRSFK